jgi:hypothetical protein
VWAFSGRDRAAETAAILNPFSAACPHRAVNLFANSKYPFSAHQAQDSHVERDFVVTYSICRHSILQRLFGSQGTW